MSENNYDNNINILKSDSEEKESVKVTDSEDSSKFIEKSDAEESFNYKKKWI